MKTNIEIKAKAERYLQIKDRVEELSGQKGILIVQEDIFFRVPKGRLKLRILNDSPSQLIYYERPNVAGPKLSKYYVTHTTEPGLLSETLSAALGVLGVVRKQRLLFHVDQTRIHLDDVDGLGLFVELEVVINKGQSLEEGRQIAHNLMDQLNIQENDLVEGAYLDLLLQRSNDHH